VHPTTAPPAPICGIATRFISPAYIAQGDAAASMPTATTYLPGCKAMDEDCGSQRVLV